MREPKPGELRDPQQALRAYLDEMLHLATGAPRGAAAAPADETESRDPVRRRPGRGEVEGTAEPVPRPRPIEVAPAVDRDAATTTAAGPPASPAGRPAPAVERFRFPLQCLMFSLAGHRLALPLTELAGVIRAETRLSRLPGLPREVLGLLRHRERTLRVVDSGALLGIAAGFEPRRGYLLLLAAGDWALTCDAPEEVVHLGRDDVHWRAGGDGRLRYGTIRESLATLLDPGAICRRLERRFGA